MRLFDSFKKTVSDPPNSSLVKDAVSSFDTQEQSGKNIILGLDVGGTHTDVVLLDRQGIIRDIKVLTNSSDLFQSVLSGIEKIIEGIDTKQIRRAVLSTTLTTNAIVTGKTEPVGMIVSPGPGMDPELFRTNECYYVVGGSIDHRGREVDPINREEIERVAEILTNKGICYLGVVGKFSTRNPDHETQIEEILANRFEKIFLGHRISGNLNFPRRIATTFLNALVYPTHKRFFSAVKQSLKEKGLQMPIQILKADGGTMNFEASIEFPGQTLLSGPSASVMGAVPYASEGTDTFVLDIGGTTTDIAVLINRSPILEPLGIQIGPYKTLIRSLKTLSIGIGGDSVVRVKEGKIWIGPDRIGPAMAYGGSTPTPTDALFILGIATNGDKEKSVTGFQPIAELLGMTLENAASEVFDMACKEILGQARIMVDDINSKPVYTIHELQEGYRVKPSKILVLGGPAVFFADRLRSLSDYEVTPLPKCGVANAIGAALARPTCEVTLFADTQRGVLTAPEEDFTQIVTKQFSKENAIEKAFELLKEKAFNFGASPEDMDFEVLEQLQFNMVQGFYTVGRNIRVKVQIKPGLINGYEKIAETLARQKAH